ncbi:protein NLRC3-like isoform X1, partial [Clarias magur]
KLQRTVMLYSKLQRTIPESPPPSCVSMKSSMSMDLPWNYKIGNISSIPSCLSMKSDRSMDIPWNYKNGNLSSIP